MLETTFRQDLKPVLMQPQAGGIKESYFVIYGDNQNMTVVSPGKNGVEYNKTFGYFHIYKGAIIYRCLYGQGLIIMQRNDEFDEAKEFKIVTLHQGRQVEVPAGYGHCAVNIGKSFLVLIDNSPGNIKFKEKEYVKNRRGFVYYIVEKKGEIGFEHNPNYQIHPQITTE